MKRKNSILSPLPLHVTVPKPAPVIPVCIQYGVRRIYETVAPDFSPLSPQSFFPSSVHWSSDSGQSGYPGTNLAMVVRCGIIMNFVVLLCAAGMPPFMNISSQHSIADKQAGASIIVGHGDTASSFRKAPISISQDPSDNQPKP